MAVEVDVVDLGFGVLTVPVGEATRLLDDILPADAHYTAVAAERRSRPRHDVTVVLDDHLLHDWLAGR